MALACTGPVITGDVTNATDKLSFEKAGAVRDDTAAPTDAGQ